MSDKHYVGLDLVSFEDAGLYKPISRVTLFVDDENCYTAGDDTGMELTAECASATQEMVNAILAKVKGHRYRAYSGSAANLDPAAELGDGVTVGGLYSVISSLSDDGGGYPDISAPGEAELEEEFPSESPMQKEFDRKIARTRSEIIKTAEEIRLDILGEDGPISKLEVSIEGINAEVFNEDGSSRLDMTAEEIRQEIFGENGAFTVISATLDGLTVTDSSGTTRIKGSSIETDTLKVKAANITGLLSASQIKLGGDMTMYQSLDSDLSAGTIGYSEVNATNSSGQQFGGMALGIKSEAHACLMALQGNIIAVSLGNVIMGSVAGDVSLSGQELRFNGKAIMDRLSRYEAAFNAIGISFNWANDE